VRIAFFSCQDWQAGYFGAHRAIAAEDVHLAVCLGDYIYERNFYEGPRRDTLGANKDGEAHTLEEYRAKYRMYRSDPDLQAMHHNHALVAMWDDHEVEDNYTGVLPGDKTLDRRIPFLDRRRNGYRAFYEYMPLSPITRPTPRGHDTYRKFRVGRNVEMFLLDQRQYRDDQPCGDAPFARCPDAETTPRRFLGDRQLEWLKRGLEGSQANWKLIGNQLMIMSLEAAGGVLITVDSWDGYGVERRDLLGFIERRGIRNVSFLTGDIHTFFAGDVGVNGRGPGSVATEFVGGSVTSLGVAAALKEQFGADVPEEYIVLVTGNAGVTNPHIKYNDMLRRGYGILEARPNELLVQFKGLDATKRNAPTSTIGRFRVAGGTPRVEVL
jgi:alkaline phosphatase D